MKTQTFISARDQNGNQVAFKLPEGVTCTRKLKETQARIKFSLKTSEDTSIGATCFFKSIEDAEKAYQLNSKNPYIICSKPVLIKKGL